MPPDTTETLDDDQTMKIIKFLSKINKQIVNLKCKTLYYNIIKTH